MSYALNTFQSICSQEHLRVLDSFSWRNGNLFSAPGVPAQCNASGIIKLRGPSRSTRYRLDGQSLCWHQQTRESVRVKHCLHTYLKDSFKCRRSGSSIGQRYCQAFCGQQHALNSWTGDTRARRDSCRRFLLKPKSLSNDFVPQATETPGPSAAAAAAEEEEEDKRGRAAEAGAGAVASAAAAVAATAGERRGEGGCSGPHAPVESCETLRLEPALSLAAALWALTHAVQAFQLDPPPAYQASGVLRLEVPFPLPVDPLKWLRAQPADRPPLSPTVYFSPRTPRGSLAGVAIIGPSRGAAAQYIKQDPSGFTLDPWGAQGLGNGSGSGSSLGAGSGEGAAGDASGGGLMQNLADNLGQLDLGMLAAQMGLSSDDVSSVMRSIEQKIRMLDPSALGGAGLDFGKEGGPGGGAESALEGALLQGWAGPGGTGGNSGMEEPTVPTNEEIDGTGVGSVAGLGACLQVTAASPFSLQDWHFMRRYMADSSPLVRFFGAMRFNPDMEPAPEWLPFGAFHFVLPLVELRECEDCALLSCTLLWDSELQICAQVAAQRCLEALGQLVAREDESLPRVEARIVSRETLPDEPAWHRAVHATLQALGDDEGEEEGGAALDSLLLESPDWNDSFGQASSEERMPLTKVVMARRTLLETQHAVNPFSVLANLQEKDSSAYQFCMRLSSGHAFLGSTPERLLARRGLGVASEAVAATRRRESSPQADLRTSFDLILSAKDSNEFEIVRESVHRNMGRVCEKVEVEEEKRIIKQARVQHLYSRINGVLYDDIGEYEMLAMLHPTPAVCGHPQAPAKAAIASSESFDRGMYAGPVGWFGGGGCEFAVGIRSALIVPAPPTPAPHEPGLSPPGGGGGASRSNGSATAGLRGDAEPVSSHDPDKWHVEQAAQRAAAGSRVLLYAGVGIVRGARAAAEWQELNLKISQFEALLGQQQALDDAPNINSLWAALAVEECCRLGCTYFCIAPGSRSSPLAIAAASNPHARVVVCIDERSLAYNALGFSRGAGRPAVVITSSGTAVSNLYPAVVEASQDCVPLVLLVADRPAELRDTGANQTINQVNHFGSYVRYHVDLPAPDTAMPARMLLTTLDQAIFRACTSQPAGPVHINCQFREPLAPREHAWDAACLKGLDRWRAGGGRAPFTSYVPPDSVRWLPRAPPASPRSAGGIWGPAAGPTRRQGDFMAELAEGGEEAVGVGEGNANASSSTSRSSSSSGPQQETAARSRPGGARQLEHHWGTAAAAAAAARSHLALGGGLQDVMDVVQGARRGLVVVGGLHREEETWAAAMIARHLAWPVVADVASGLRVLGSSAGGMSGVAVVHHLDHVLLHEEASALLAPDVILQLGGRVTSKRVSSFLEAAALAPDERPGPGAGPREGVVAGAEAAAHILVEDHPLRSDAAHLLSHRVHMQLPAFLEALQCATASRYVARPLLARWGSGGAPDGEQAEEEMEEGEEEGQGGGGGPDEVLERERAREQAEYMELLLFLSEVAGAEIAARLDEAEALSEPWAARAVAASVAPGSALFLGNSMAIRDVDMYSPAGALPPAGEGDAALLFGPRVGCNRGASGIDGVLSTAVGFAAGCKRPVTFLVGDVSFLHDTNGLTLLSERSGQPPVTVVVVNNQGGAIFSMLPVAATLPTGTFTPLFSTPHDVALSQLCRAHRVAHVRVEGKEELLAALAAAQRARRHYVIEVASSIASNTALHRELQQVVKAAVRRAVGVLLAGPPRPFSSLAQQATTVSTASYSCYQIALSAPPTTTEGEHAGSSDSGGGRQSQTRRGLLVHLALRCGAQGIGEVAPLPGLHEESLQEAEAQLRLLLPCLVGCHLPLGLALLDGRMGAWLSHTLGTEAEHVHPSVRCGLEGAVLTALASSSSSSPSSSSSSSATSLSGLLTGSAAVGAALPNAHNDQHHHPASVSAGNLNEPLWDHLPKAGALTPGSAAAGHQPREENLVEETRHQGGGGSSRCEGNGAAGAAAAVEEGSRDVVTLDRAEGMEGSGPKVKGGVRVCALLDGEGSAEDAVSAAQALVAQGFCTLKLKVARRASPLADAEVVRAVRAAVGWGVHLRCDANRRWTMQQAVTFGRAVHGCALEYLEEPVNDVGDLATFYAETGVPVALDESIDEGGSSEQLQLHCFQGLAAVVIKPSRMGGFELSATLVRWALRSGVRPIISSCFESSVGLSLCAEFAAYVDSEFSSSSRRALSRTGGTSDSFAQLSSSEHAPLGLSNQPLVHGLGTYSWLATDAVSSGRFDVARRSSNREGAPGMVCARELTSAVLQRPDLDHQMVTPAAELRRHREYRWHVTTAAGEYSFHVREADNRMPPRQQEDRQKQPDPEQHGGSSSGGGGGDGVTVVLLHGLLGSSSDWLPLMDALSLTHRCIAVDLPGHGSTSVGPPRAPPAPPATSSPASGGASASLAEGGNLPHGQKDTEQGKWQESGVAGKWGAAERQAAELGGARGGAEAGRGATVSERGSHFDLDHNRVNREAEGRPGGVREEMGMANVCEALAVLLKECGGGRCCVVGYSMGARIALYLALRHHPQVAAAALISGSPGLRDEHARQSRAAQDDAKAAALRTGGLETFVESWYRQPLWDSLRVHPGFERMRAERCRAGDADGLANALSALSTGRQPSLWEDLRECRPPLLLVAGSLDQKFVKIACAMQEACKGHAVSGRMPHGEQAEANAEQKSPSTLPAYAVLDNSVGDVSALGTSMQQEARTAQLTENPESVTGTNRREPQGALHGPREPIEVLEVADVGHAVHIERPERLFGALADLLSRIT